MYTTSTSSGPSVDRKRLIRIVTGALLGFILLLFVVASGKLFENVDAGEIVVMQAPVSGELTVYRKPGLKWQGWARLSTYRQSYQYTFQNESTRFNDKGQAVISGNVRWDMPTSDEKLLTLHERFGSKGGEDAIERELLLPTIGRAVYMSGSLMSSTESAAAKRTDLISYIMDQARFGVYETSTRDTTIIDPITEKETTLDIVELFEDTSAPGGYLREEPSAISEFNIRLSNLQLEEIDYANEIDDQIEQQRKITMDIQTAVAETKLAEQKAIKAAKEGEAEAEKARWEQEVLKAKAVTEAEQKREVARLDLQAAEFERQAKEERGAGEAAYKRAVMQADGALKQRLDALTEIEKIKWNAIANAKQPLVPSTTFGSTGEAGSASSMEQFLDIMTTKAVRDLQQQVTPPK